MNTKFKTPTNILFIIAGGGGALQFQGWSRNKFGTNPWVIDSVEVPISDITENPQIMIAGDGVQGAAGNRQAIAAKVEYAISMFLETDVRPDESTHVIISSSLSGGTGSTVTNFLAQKLLPLAASVTIAANIGHTDATKVENTVKAMDYMLNLVSNPETNPENSSITLMLSSVGDSDSYKACNDRTQFVMSKLLALLNGESQIDQADMSRILNPSKGLPQIAPTLLRLDVNPAELSDAVVTYAKVLTSEHEVPDLPLTGVVSYSKAATLSEVDGAGDTVLEGGDILVTKDDVIEQITTMHNVLKSIKEAVISKRNQRKVALKRTLSNSPPAESLF